MDYVLNGEELVLLLVSLIQDTHPEMLSEGEEGFVVDFAPIQESAEPLSGDDATLEKFRAALASERADQVYHMNFDSTESQRLTEVLGEFETLEGLDPRVLLVSQDLRARLQAGLHLV